MTLRPLLPAALAAAAALATLVPAHAQQEAASPPLGFAAAGTDTTLSSQAMRDRRLVFTALLGLESRPEFFGSEDNTLVPKFSPNLLALNFGPLDVGPDRPLTDDDPLRRPLGFGVGGSFRYVSPRSDDDFDELDGLDDVDGALELGATVGYVWPSLEAFGQLRYGVTGHESWVGEVGAYYVARPVDDFALRIGPRLLFGSDGYTDTYFGVDADEATASDFEEYDPEGGLVSAGVEVIATYRIGQRWWLEGRARWDQYQDDAADSPIVEQGTQDNGTVSIGVRRAFVLDF